MTRTFCRPALVISGLALLLASCSDDASPTTSTTTEPSETTAAVSSTTIAETTSTTTTTPETSTTTTTTEARSPTLAVQGDSNETVEAIQFLLNCNGHGELVVDGVFGPATLAAVETAQASLGRTVDGRVDDDTMADLSRSCPENRRLEGEGVLTVVGNTAPEDPEDLSIALLSGSTVAVTVTQGIGVTVNVIGVDGGEVPSEGQSTWQIETTQDYRIRVTSEAGPVTFTLAVVVTLGELETGDWILATDGVIYRGTKLAHGDDAQTVIDQVFEFLGHGIRGAYDEFDTDWYTITEPAPTALRGIFTEGFAFLFFGPPDPENPDRPETFVRHRFEGPGLDADGNPRPENYATTAEGITVGDTVADLVAVYGDRVSPGSNSREYYYRFTDGGGELCFYVGAEEPTDFSPIIEIASECRTG
jgi:peptidoglycan hydrolase-like protein with peptidoglycan-binding domain